MADSRITLRGRLWVTSARFTQRVDAALKPVLAEDDHLIAGASVVTGPPPAPIALGTFLINAAAWPVAGVVANILTPGTIPPPIWLIVVLGLSPILVFALIVSSVQRPRFLAISRRQMIYARLTPFRKRPAGIVTVPLNGARIDSCRRGPRTTSITLNVTRKRLRLHGFAKKQDDLDEVIYLARAAGVPIVAMAPRVRRSLQPPFDYGPSLSGLPEWSRWPAD
jgi:hypothetical protein